MLFHIHFLYISHCSLHSIKLFLSQDETIEPNKVTTYKSRVVKQWLRPFTFYKTAPVQRTHLL